MTTKVPAHKVDNHYSRDFVLGNLEFVRDKLPAQIVKDARRAGSMVSTVYIRACQALLINDTAACLEQLGASLDCAVAGFKAWYHTETVEFEYQGKILKTTGAEPGRGATERAWIHAMSLALLFDRQNAIDSLCDYDFDLFDRSPGVNDDYWRPLAQLYRSFVTYGVDWAPLVEMVECHTGPEHISVGSPRLAVYNGSLVPVMQAIRNDDANAFNEAVAVALQAFKGWWGRGKNKNDPEGLLCIGVAGLAALGIRQALSYEVESGYVPGWLLTTSRKVP